MKKISLILLALLISITFISCEDDAVTDPIIETGTIVIDSSPQGAEIWLETENTNQVTPATITVDAGVRTIMLKKEGYEDLIVQVSVEAGGEAVITSNSLVALSVTFSTPVRIWETTGTDATQPSGLDLSTGDAFGTSDANNNGNIDLYYFSSSDGTTFLVQSAHINANMTRETFFKVGSASDLEDGVASTVKDANWTNTMSDRETNYVFLYDADGHYSKLIITNFNAGSGPGDPSWVEVAWVYNTAQDNTTF